MSEDIEITILMPCLNEAETIKGCIKEALSTLSSYSLRGEVLIADNGSTDGSPQIAENAGAGVINIPQQGYGSALLGGIKAAKGEYILMGDADGSYNFGELPRFIEKLRQGDDLVMGCRFPKGGGKIYPGAMPWKHRWIGNPLLSAVGKLFFSSSVDDFHCGLRGFRKDAIMSLGLCTKGMEFASEMVVKASLCGLKISQVPITLRCDRRSRPSHLRSWRDGWRHLRFMLLYSPNWLFIAPGAILTILGLIGFIFLLPQPLTLVGITFDINTLLVSSTTILVGTQILFFGLIIKTYATAVGLWPGNKRWKNFIKGRPIEWGIGIGLFFILAGSGYLINAILSWHSVGFGQLSYQESLRTVIPAVTGIGVGFQVLFSGFVLALLGLER